MTLQHLFFATNYLRYFAASFIRWKPNWIIDFPHQEYFCLRPGQYNSSIRQESARTLARLLVVNSPTQGILLTKTELCFQGVNFNHFPLKLAKKYINLP